MNLLYEPFPETVTADGQVYRIPTDFREWLRFADMLTDSALSLTEKAYLCGKWLSPEPKQITPGIVEALVGFYRADALHPAPTEPEEDADAEEAPPQRPYFDWSTDAAFVLGDFLRFYRIDLLTVRLHWWTFRALFEALPDDSKCMQRIAYRSADLSGIRDKGERARIAKIQKQIALPFVFDDEAIGEVFNF